MRYRLFTEPIVEVQEFTLVTPHETYVTGMDKQVAGRDLDFTMEQMCVR
jgi:hypothetical protein